ncbi:MAG: pilus assembly protein [Bryobacterales bacterium]|nr:pilus assembly protein [Bryobacterales bacterium]
MLLLTMIVGMFEFTWVLFVRATFHHAVRAAVRFAITGGDGSGLDDEIKQVIKENSFGLLNDADLDAYVGVEFYDPNCGSGATCPAGGAASAGVADAEAGSIIRVTISCYDMTPITTLVRKTPSGGAFPFVLSVSATDKMEPYPGAPPNRGTLADPTACAP